MTAEPALLAAIAARPDDDTPRLVYADWLDDRGDAARAEFIRLQCALARGGPDDPAAAERADELENAHRTSWLMGVPTGPGLRWEFRRGFPERLEADAERLLEHYERVVAVPWLCDLCLIGADGHSIREFVSRRWPPAWVALELVGAADPTGRIPPEIVTMGVVRIADHPQSRQLQVLRLGQGFQPSRTAVAAIADSPHLRGLHLMVVPDDRERLMYAPLRARFGERLVGEGA